MLHRHFARAILKPAQIEGRVSLLRRFLCAPVIFDIVSLTLQARDTARLRTIKGKYISTNEHLRAAHDYNAGVTVNKQITTTRRAEVIYKMLSFPPRNLREEKLLIVGPRNISEIFIAWVYGFSWKNIYAVDLYSTNPKIRTMNMEEMDFSDNTFDAVSMSATLAYAESISRTISEVARILKPGGRFAFTHGFAPGRTQWPGNIVHAKEIQSILTSNDLGIYIHFGFDKENSIGNIQTTHRFAAIKAPPKLMDDFSL